MATAIDNALVNMKRDLQGELEKKFNRAHNKNDLKAMAHSEEFGQYNRRANWRISSIPEAPYIDQKGKTRPETPQASVHKSSNLGDSFKAN